MLSRRQFAAMSLASLSAGVGRASVNSTIRGVRIGVQSASFTFSGIGIDGIIQTMSDLGIAEIDVMSEHVENYLGGPVQLPGAGRPGPWARPPLTPAPGGAGRGPGFGRGADPAAREALRKWRLEVDLDRYRSVAKKFQDAGLKFFSYNLSFNDSFTEDEIEKGFQMTKALRTSIITASSPLSVFPRLIPFAEKYNVTVALHNHTTGPEAFAKAIELSKHFWVNLDIGHFFASGYDPLGYIREHHARITNIHIKDRKRNGGAEMPFGEGDTPLKDVLLLLSKEKYEFPACIEYVGPAGPAAELKTCFDYCKRVLAAA